MVKTEELKIVNIEVNTNITYVVWYYGSWITVSYGMVSGKEAIPFIVEFGTLCDIGSTILKRFSCLFKIMDGKKYIVK